MNNPTFQKFPDEDTYFSLKSDERVYLDLRATSGYVKEAEKLKRNDSKINKFTYLTKWCNNKKVKGKNMGLFPFRILVYFNKERT